MQHATMSGLNQDRITFVVESNSVNLLLIFCETSDFK